MRFAPILLALVTLVSTGLGGTAAIRLRDRLHLLLGFSSGAVLAVALFDILPEVFAFNHGASYMPITALGFLAFFGLERYTAMHRAREHPHLAEAHEAEHLLRVEDFSLLLPMSSTMWREGARSGASASLSPGTSAESEFS